MNRISFLMILCMVGIMKITNAQQRVNREEVKNAAINVEKGIKLNINTGFHFSNMIGKDIEKEDNLFISAHSTNGSPYSYGCYGLYAGGYKKLLPGYKLGLGITFDITKNFAWGFDLNFETKGCLIPIKEIIITYYTTTTYPIYISSDEEKRVAASNLHSKIRLNYIVIPIRTEFKYKKFYLMSGIYTGFLLNAVNTTKFDYENHSFDIRRTPTHHYALIDLGVFLNAGFCFPFLDRHFIKIGLVGEWNINGVENCGLRGGKYSFFNNQVLGFELKYEIKIK